MMMECVNGWNDSHVTIIIIIGVIGMHVVRCVFDSSSSIVNTRLRGRFERHGALHGDMLCLLRPHGHCHWCY